MPVETGRANYRCSLYAADREFNLTLCPKDFSRAIQSSDPKLPQSHLWPSYKMVATAWNECRNSGMEEALFFMLAPASARDLESVLSDKTESPLSAEIATYLAFGPQQALGAIA